MKRSKIALAATSGLVGLSVLAGSMTFAQGTAGRTDAAELQQFLAANPAVAAVVAQVEAQTGGTVVEAEFDDDHSDNSVVEFEVMMANGSEHDVRYTLASGEIVTEADDLQQFLTSHPEVAAALADVETRTGGTVIEAEFDDDHQGNGVVEFEVRMADGAEQDVLYTLADGTMTIDG